MWQQGVLGYDTIPALTSASFVLPAWAAARGWTWQFVRSL